MNESRLHIDAKHEFANVLPLINYFEEVTTIRYSSILRDKNNIAKTKAVFFSSAKMEKQQINNAYS